MTTQRAAYEEFTVRHGSNIVRLRPSLRAATHLERLHDGFENLFKRVDQFDTATIKAIITTAATDDKAADTLLTAAESLPLRGFISAVHAPVIALIAALIPTPADGDQKPITPGKPIAWSTLYKQLFQIATGWLGWSPDAAWSATPSEIAEAFNGHMQKLKAIHGGASDDQDNNASTMTAEQRAENEAAGLDPDFDREGLRALKARHAR